MAPFRPKFISFDCYGTLTHFRMHELAREIYGDRVPAVRLPAFLADFSAYRLDEVLGAWKPYAEVLTSAMERTCRKHEISFDPAETTRFSDAVPTWGPHPDVPAGLRAVAKHIPLVGLSNAANAQIMLNVAQYEAPFHAVYTAEMAQAYKPHMRPFEYMFDMLGCGPEEMAHVSSSMRYDLMVAHDLGFGRRFHVMRGHEPSSPYYGATEIRDIGELAGALGL